MESLQEVWKEEADYSEWCVQTVGWSTWVHVRRSKSYTIAALVHTPRCRCAAESGGDADKLRSLRGVLGWWPRIAGVPPLDLPMCGATRLASAWLHSEAVVRSGAYRLRCTQHGACPCSTTQCVCVSGVPSYRVLAGNLVCLSLLI